MNPINAMDKLWVLLALRHNFEMRVLANKVRSGSMDFDSFYAAMAREMMLFSEGQMLMSEKKYGLIGDWFEANTSNEAKDLLVADLAQEIENFENTN